MVIHPAARLYRSSTTHHRRHHSPPFTTLGFWSDGSSMCEWGRREDSEIRRGRGMDSKIPWAAPQRQWHVLTDPSDSSMA